MRCGMQPQNVGKLTLSQLEAVMGGDKVTTLGTMRELEAFYASL